MSGRTGQNTLSIRKTDTESQRGLSLGFKNLRFAHKATLGDTGIDLTALVTPSTEMPAFVQPSLSDISSAKFFINKRNLTIISSAKGTLQQDLSYDVVSNSRIAFRGFTAEDGEIFTGYLDSNPRTGLSVVDAQSIVKTGPLAIGVTDFVVGTPFEYNKNPGEQQGDILVYVDGVLQMRNVGNAAAAPSADGNYQELNNTTIRMNTSEAYERNVIVVSNGLSVNRPNDSRDAAIEQLAATIDNMVPVLADAAGVPENQFQGQPSQPDLANFGNRVLALENYLLKTADFDAEAFRKYLVDNTGSTHTATLPASPAIGQWVEFWDSHSQWGSNIFTIARNGSNIEGVAADFTVNTNDIRLRLVYAGASRGWIIGDLS